MTPPFRLALITGASSGLGTSLARCLAAEKIPLILTGRNQVVLNSLSNELKAECLPLDLNHDCDALLRLIKERAPDLVINNAGFTLYGPVLSHTIAEEASILCVNAIAPRDITLSAAQALKERGRQGAILNIASAAALLTYPQMASYAAAKAFIISFSQSFDAEMAPHGIRVLTALPGQIATSFAERASRGNFRQTISFLAMDPDRVAREIWRQIQRRKRYLIIDWRYRYLMKLQALFPSSWVASILEEEISSRCEGL